MIDIETPLFKSLPGEALERISATAETRRFAPGEVMLHEGEVRGELFVLRSGEAIVVGRDWHGESKALGRIGPGECFGEISMLSGEPASATVEAVADSEAWVLPHGAIFAVAEEYPELGRNLSALLAGRLRAANDRQLRAQRGELVALVAAGAPHWAFWLAYRLAASIARHKRQAVAFADLSGLAAEASLPHQARSLTESRALASSDGVDAGEPLEVFYADSAGMSEPRILSGIDRLQERNRCVVAFLAAEGAIAQTIGSRADQRLALVRETDVAESIGEGTGVILLSDRPDVPTVGRLRSAGAIVRHIVPGGEQALEPEASRGSASGRSIDRLARRIAGLSIGLALGGGGAKGYAHIGVIRGLERHGVPVDCVTGCSIGAALAAGVAAGWTIDEIRDQLDAISQKALRLNVPIVSILTSRAIRAELEAVVAGRRFEDLPTPLGIVAVDIERGEEVLMRSGLIWPAMLASMAYPGVYEPVRIRSRYLVDGGVLSPVPVSSAVALGANVVISSNLNASPLKPKRLSKKGLNPRRLILENITRSLEIMQRKIAEESCNRADISIEPLFDDPPGLLDFKRGRLLEKAGEEAAEQALSKLRAALPWLG